MSWRVLLDVLWPGLLIGLIGIAAGLFIQWQGHYMAGRMAQIVAEHRPATECR